MKYTMKITASLMAAAMSVSILGAASAGAIEFTVVGGNTTGTGTTTTTTTATTTVSSVVQNAVPEFFNGCIKLNWSAVSSAASYAVKICTTDGTVVKTYYVSNKYNAVLVPETVFDVEYNTKKDFYVCVVALRTGESDTALTTFYVPTASKFTVNSDMSAYPDYGAPQSVAFAVKDGKLYIGWKNPNDFMNARDIFAVSIEDHSGKTVFSQSVTSTNVAASGLKDGETYTVKIINKSFSAMTSTNYTFVSDLAKKQAGESSSETAPKKDSTYRLPAPNSINAKTDDSKVTLSWSSVEGADGYRIYIYDSASNKYKSYKTIKSTKCTIKNLSNGKSYKFKVAAVRYNSSTKKYEAGKTSGTATATPAKPSSSLGGKKTAN